MSTINTIKEQEQALQPLLLAVITLADASVLRLSTHPLNTADGGYQYGGNDYEPRILSYSINAVQAVSEQGISVLPRMSITVADPDKYVWTSFKNIKGAAIEVTFLFWDADSSTFSSDTKQTFTGICDGLQSVTPTQVVISAKNRLDLQRKFLPVMPIQMRCPWFFPTTATQRQAAADDSDSRYYHCGYSPDASGANARGNGSYTSCNFTKADCVLRGMYEEDGSSRTTGRFGGIQWQPPTGGRSRQYVSGDILDVKNDPNEARYGDYVPLVYGTAWVEPPVIAPIGEANSTRTETVLSMGTIEAVFRVAVNDVEIQAASGMDHAVRWIQDPLMAWYLVNRGDRDGAPNVLPGYTHDQTGLPLGDPYGGMATICTVVYKDVAGSDSIPTIRAQIRGRWIRVYTDTSTYTTVWNYLTPWVIMDLLVLVGFTYSDLDIQSFIDAAAIAGENVIHTDQYGNADSSQLRFGCSLVIRRRRSAADVIGGLLRSCDGLLIPNTSTGKLELHLKQTLAEQQPSTVAGSNYDTAVTSMDVDQIPANGYAAYKFDDSTIIQLGGVSTLKLWQRPNSDTPNIVNIGFINAGRDYAADTLRLPDATDVNLIGQEVEQNVGIEGCGSLDQAKRVGATFLAEGLRGNDADDTGGTIYGELETTFRAVRLRVGHICLLSDVHHGITDQLIRILSIQPDTNFETCKIGFQFHEDYWYTDPWGQNADPGFSDTARDRLRRPSFPWCPYSEQPDADDPMFDASDWNFSLSEVHETAADGTAITRVAVTGKQPVNLFSSLQPPKIAIQGTTASSGGTIPGGGVAYYLVICARDSDGLLTAPSNLCVVDVTDDSSPGGENTISVEVHQWDSDTAGYVVFCGNSPNRLSYQDEVASPATPSSVTLTAYNERTWGVPDGEFDKLGLKVKRIAHSGVFGRALSTVGSSSLTFDPGSPGWDTDEWIGYDISVIARTEADVSPAVTLEILNFSITGNDADTLTVTPDPLAAGIVAGDVFVMRSLPVVDADADGNYIEDANWVNDLAGTGTGLAVDQEIGRLLRIIAGTGRGHIYRVKKNTSTRVYIDGEWTTTPDSTTRYIIEEPEFQVVRWTESLNNQDDAADITISANVDNYEGLTMLVQAVTMDGGGNESISSLCPIREIYIWGFEGDLLTDDGIVIPAYT